MCHGRVQLDALGEVGESLLVLALKTAEGAAHIISKSLVLVKIAQLQGLFECRRCFVIAWGGLALQEVQTNQELALASIIRDLRRFLQASRPRLGPETLQVVSNKRCAWEPSRLVRKNLLGLLLGEFLQQPLDRFGTGLVLEPIDNAARGVVQKSFTILTQFVIGTGATVEGLDVLWVEVESGSAVVDNTLPVTSRVVASGTVGVVDRIRFAEDGLGIEVDSFGVVVALVRLVTRLLQLGGVFFANLLRQLLYGVLVNLGEFIGGLNCSRLRIRALS